METNSTTRSRARPIALVVLGVAFAALLALLVMQQRQMARLEATVEALASSKTDTAPPRPLGTWAPRSTEPAPRAEAPPRPIEARPMEAPSATAAPGQPLAEARLPESRDFIERMQLRPRDWSMILIMNRYWYETVEKASREGEASLTDSLEYVAAQRESKLRRVMGTDERYRQLQDFEGKVSAPRALVRSADGRSYEAANFE